MRIFSYTNVFKMAIVFFIFLTTNIFALEVEVGDWIQLKATKPIGVPLHRNSASSLFDRADDGSKAVILFMDDNKHWIQIQLEDRRFAWIVERYVDRVINPPLGVSVSDTTVNHETLVWSSLEGCKEQINNGFRMSHFAQDTIRMATWNVRWFADETNIEWLACAIVWMNVDILAVQEFRNDDNTIPKLTQLLEFIKDFNGVEWDSDLHECGRKDAQHIGHLWNTERIENTANRDLWQFNARANQQSSPCKSSLRPGRYGYFKAKNGGVDFSSISVHLKMGANLSAQNERFQVFHRIGQAKESIKNIRDDEDIIIVGDWNTMGNGSADSNIEEIDDFNEIISDDSVNFVKLEPRPSCSEYYQKKPGLLDHIIISRDMSEINSITAVTTGYCAVHSCNPVTEFPKAYQELSDHCPIVFEIKNEDIDN